MTTLVTFDIDNTLIQGSTGHAAAMISAINDTYDVNTRIDIINYHGMTDPEIVRRILEKWGMNSRFIDSRLNECLNRMQQRYAEIVKSENIVMLRGVSALLNRLIREGVYLGLVTGNLETIAFAKLKKIGINGYFKYGGFGSDHMNRTELMKIAIRRATQNFGLDDSLSVFHVGDAEQDMAAARGGGATPIGVTTGVYSASELKSAGAHRVVSNLEDSREILRLMIC